MRFLGFVPFHFWLIVLYLVALGVFVGADVYTAAIGADEAEAAAATLAQLEGDLNARIFDLPLLTNVLPISMTTIFIALGFVAQWIEAIRATRLRRTGGNDFLSILIAFGALLLFAGVELFQTTAFLVVVIVGFGDVLLDRIIGQAVARRDFGGLGVPVGGGE